MDDRSVLADKMREIKHGLDGKVVKHAIALEAFKKELRDSTAKELIKQYGFPEYEREIVEFYTYPDGRFVSSLVKATILAKLRAERGEKPQEQQHKPKKQREKIENILDIPTQE